MNRMLMVGLALALNLAAALYAAPPPPSRAAWFEAARFGLFIHWNACAGLEGRYCGEPVRQGWYGEWLRARNRVPREDWDAAVRQMHITPRQVEAWAEAAKQAGMRYVVFVAKHHDGLAYWPSKVSDYTFNDLTGTRFDLLACLKRACDKRGLKLGFYYSQWQDWEHPGGWGNFWEFNSKDPKQFEGREDLYYWDGTLFRDNLSPEQFDAYWRQKAMPQVEELVRNYQPALIWFDCYAPRTNTIMSQQQVDDMLGLIRRLDPRVLVNSRLPTDKVGGADGADFETLGDNDFPHQKIGHPWESPVTFPLSWGYNRDDQNWRSTTYFVRNLVRNISLGGNLIINYGPYADGVVPEEALVRMREIGRCLRGNGEGFYGCGYTPFEETTQDWGLTTTRTTPDGKHLLYLHVFDWPVDGVIRVNGLKTPVRAARLCAGDRKLRFQQQGLSTHVFAPRTLPQPYDTVIRLELAGPLDVDNQIVGELNGGGIVMNADRASLRGVKLETPPARGTKLRHQIGGWNTADAQASWKIFVPEAGPRSVKICYASTVELAGGEFLVNAGGGLELRAKTEATHRNWSEFRPFNLGVLNFPQPGEYTLTVQPTKPVSAELFKLLWVHLGEPASR